MTTDVARSSIDTVRTLAMDAVERAGSGHPGTAMALAPLGYLLYTQAMKHDPADPDWTDRDRFVLSAGHASVLQYALLHLTGYDVSLEDLKALRRWGSKTPGHPEYGHTPGVETTTGPLGQGFGNAIGMALAERLLAERFNRPGFGIVDHRTWVVAGDGDMMEGVASEAASLAGGLGLGKLTCFYDDNAVTIDAQTQLSYCERVAERFAAYGWHVLRVDDGNDLDELRGAVEGACEETGRPTLVIVRTHIGYGSPKQDSPAAHGSALGEENVRATKRFLGWPEEPAFLVPEEVVRHCRVATEQGRKAHEEWRRRFDSWAEAHPRLAEEWRVAHAGGLPDGWAEQLPSFDAPDGPMATRKASGAVLGAVAGTVNSLVGGSADLAGSTKTYLEGEGDVSGHCAYEDVAGADQAPRNIHFGVREHGMGALLNGMALHGGFRVFGGTFLVFSDYMRPPIRLAALMGLPVVYVFTHDSIGLGEDGPTHQPVEHLAALRVIPDLVTLRPADANETAGAWRVALERRDGPTALVFSRQGLPVLPDVPPDAVSRGAHVVADGRDVVLLGTGSEVHLCLEAREALGRDGVSARVVSMPSWELFEGQGRAYREEVLPPDTPVLAVEAGSSIGWCRWADETVSLDRFGASAPGEVVFRELGFTSEYVAESARGLVGR